jgi:hypothetical protein
VDILPDTGNSQDDGREFHFWGRCDVLFCRLCKYWGIFCFVLGCAKLSLHSFPLTLLSSTRIHPTHHHFDLLEGSDCHFCANFLKWKFLKLVSQS